MKTAFVYTHRYFDYTYGTSHPLKNERLRMTHDLCGAYGLFDLPDTTLVETVPATEEEVLRFHKPDYIAELKKASRGLVYENFLYGLGPGDNPVFPGVWEWSLLQSGASLQCARLVAEKQVRIAFNIAGGLHHAQEDRASGFCYVNDPVLAILHFIDQGYRVLYLDVDAHHGDGVQWAFYDDPRVLTLSFHQDGRTLFPGTGGIAEMGKGKGEGYSVNVPMLPGTDDDVFWQGFVNIVPRLLEAFRPDVIVSQLGVDTFRDDPLANLELTTNGFCKVVSYLREQAPAWVALGGGGYNVDNVARAWTLAWAGMNGVELPEELPACRIQGMATEGRKLRDVPHSGYSQARCAQRIEECIRYLEANLFPIL
ncbi:MAG: acetoin utilization protein AcuC [Deltaproteobacteria bacterium]|nr:acetoin utilization protein AcuC [Deltaproteobacteria bacterium]